MIALDKLADDGKVAYRVNAQANVLLSANLQQIATPVISTPSGTFAINCATPGAAIFYTLDGSNPTPRNGTLYAAPFAATSGQVLTARAWLAGWLASEKAIMTT
jgi:hypothetical protein